MKKTHYLSLLYLLGVAPIVRALSSATTSNPVLSFGLFNIIGLSIYALIFSSLSNRKKSSGLAIIGVALIVGVGIFGVSKIGKSVSDRLYNKALAPMPGEITSQTGDIDHQTGDLLTGMDSLSGDNSDDIDDVATDNNSDIEEEEKEPTTASDDMFADLSDTALLNYGQVIPYLVETYDLQKSGTRAYNFGNIPAGSPLQQAFEIAASHAMIGTSTNPDSNPSCDTYLVLKGIAAQRDVGSYTGAPQAAYRAHAAKNGQVNNCLEGQFVTKLTL